MQTRQRWQALCAALLWSAACGDDRAAPEHDAATPGADAGALDASVDAEARADAARDASLDGEQPADDASQDASGDSGPPDTFASKPFSSPPSYQGSTNNGAACNTSYKTTGFAPSGVQGARYPLFLYFTGTSFAASDLSSKYDNAGAAKVTEAMARRGFVALSAAYDNTPATWLSDRKNLLSCLFSAQNTKSLLAAACALPEVDCDQGIAVWGHSLGGLVAHMACNGDQRVRAAWTTGYGGEGVSRLSKRRWRAVNGEADGQIGNAAALNTATGLTASECPEPDQCLRSDGSGWIIVRAKNLKNPSASADHCWFDRAACASSGALSLEPNWIDASSSQPFALEANADWLARTARDTQLP